MRQFWVIVRRPFTLDLRALALLRIGTAAVILLDLAIRSTDLEAHYSNLGVLPLAALAERAWTPYQFSLHASSGLWQVQAVFFIIAAAVAVALLLGYHTRLATLASWVLLVSLQNRNPLIGQGGDDLLRMLLFWGFFLPWGRVWSRDARQVPPATSYAYCGASSVAYIAQLALLYWCTAILKEGREWTHDGTALYYALSLDQLLLPGGRLLYPHAGVLQFLTFATWYTELLLPFALFIPFRVAWWRLLVIGVLSAFHIGISLTLFVGIFFIVNLVSLLGLFPPGALDWLSLRFSQHIRRVKRWQTSLPLPSWQLPWQLQIQQRTPIPPAILRVARIMQEAVVVASLVYVCWWNLDDVSQPNRWMSNSTRWLGYLFRIDQHWGMFAPTVFKDDGWFVLEGRTENGTLLDLNRSGNPVTYAKPHAIVRLFKNDRWRKYSENYLFIDHAWMRPYYCNYWLRIWKQAARPPLTTLTIVYMKELSLPNYRVSNATREVLCGCTP
jgi:hypothetical protein